MSSIYGSVLGLVQEVDESVGCWRKTLWPVVMDAAGLDFVLTSRPYFQLNLDPFGLV